MTKYGSSSLLLEAPFIGEKESAISSYSDSIWRPDCCILKRKLELHVLRASLVPAFTGPNGLRRQYKTLINHSLQPRHRSPPCP
jgi:hypothetical protein